MPDSEVTARMVKIVDRLLEGTRAGRVDWVATDDENAFLYVGSGTSAIIEHVAAPFPGRHSLRVINPRGTEISRIDTEFYEDINLEDGSPIWVHRDHNRPIISLYDLARRRALKVDESLDNMLRELEGG